MPLSLLEAMSYGNCCLTSDIDECSEVLEDKGVIFKKTDITDLADKLKKLCNDNNLVRKYKDESQNFILNKYNWDEVTKSTLTIYKKVSTD